LMDRPTPTNAKQGSMTLIRKAFIAIAMLLIVGNTAVANDPPLPPQEIFHYVVYDAGDALEI